MRADEQMFLRIKVSDRLELVKYKNKSFSVGQTEANIDIKMLINE